MNKTILISFILCLGCANCSSAQQNEPNIREQPYIEFCPQACSAMDKTHLNCSPYSDAIPVDDDGGTWTCTEYFTYQNKNSIPMNCSCMAQIHKCSQIDCSLRIVDKCNSTTNIDQLCP